MITKQEFLSKLSALQKTMETEDELYKASNKSIALFENEVFSNFIDEYIKSLSTLIGLENDRYTYNDLDYFIFELEFGKEYKEGCVKDDDVIVDFSTPEKFYDYIYEKHNEKKNRKEGI